MKWLNYARQAAVTWVDHCVVQKINNPDYKGKWKAPLIDNPDIFTFNFEQRQFHLRLTLLSISTFMLILEVHMHLFIDVCRIQGRCLHLRFRQFEAQWIIDLLHEHNDFLSYVVWCLTNFHSLSGTLFDNILITDDPLIWSKIKCTQFCINLQCGCKHT